MNYWFSYGRICKNQSFKDYFSKKHLNTVLCGKVHTESRFALKTAEVKFF